METTNLTMEERLEVWRQRKKNTGGGNCGGRSASKANVDISNCKLARKRNRKYINSSLTGPQPTTPHPHHNKTFEIQKRTKQENDFPDSKHEKGTPRHCAPLKSSPGGGIAGIDGSLQDMHLEEENINNSNQQDPPSMVAFVSRTTPSPSTLEQLNHLAQANAELTKKSAMAIYEGKEAFKIAQMSVAENEALSFENEVLNQTVESLETQLSQSRMASFEAAEDTEKVKRQQATIRFLRLKNEEYEARANNVVTEMTEQMAKLQDMAMTRIQQLENDLMLEQHKTQTYEATILKLRQTQEEMEERQEKRNRRQKASRRQSCFMSLSSMDGYSSDATQEAQEDEEGEEDEEDDTEERDFDLVLGGDEGGAESCGEEDKHAYDEM